MNKNLNIAVIGGGYVGLHTALKMIEEFPQSKITILDIDEDKVNRWNEGKSPIDDYYMNKFMLDNPHKLKNINYEIPDEDWTKYDIFFLALSTNPIPGEEHKLNTDLLFNKSKEIFEQKPDASIVIRSTINITDSSKCLEMGIGYWPEFLSQGIETRINLDRKSHVIFVPKNNAFSNEFFDELFQGKQLIKASPQEAIMVKVMHNSLDAHLITISNLFANIAEENGIDFSIIAPAVESLLKNRNKVKNPGIGYGGSCYPKDAYSLISVTKEDHNKNLIQALEDFNKDQSYAFLYKQSYIDNATNIVVLGVSFKGGTNDITRTPTVSLRKWLQDHNKPYKIWEPMISEKWLIPGENMSSDIESDIKAADLVIVASDWSGFNDLLKNYDGVVIDLKSFIKDNGMMDLHFIGKK